MLQPGITVRKQSKEEDSKADLGSRNGQQPRPPTNSQRNVLRFQQRLSIKYRGLNKREHNAGIEGGTR